MRNTSLLPVSISALLLIALFALSSNAFSSILIESEIEGAPGIRYEKLRFETVHVTLDIMNMTSCNVKFSASMFFIDKKGRVVAEAGLLPKRIAANSSSSFKSFFVTGSAETAKRSDKIVWGPQVIMEVAYK